MLTPFHSLVEQKNAQWIFKCAEKVESAEYFVHARNCFSTGFNLIQAQDYGRKSASGIPFPLFLLPLKLTHLFTGFYWSLWNASNFL
jgi:hypothetical protein